MSDIEDIGAGYDNPELEEIEVELLLKSPLFKFEKISQHNLELVRSSFTTVNSLHLLDRSEEEQQMIVGFPDCASIVDFYEEKAGVLTFSSALMRFKDSEVQQFSKPSKVPSIVSVEGFQVRNGKLKLTKKTSLDSLISENDQSTNHVSHSDLDTDLEQEQWELEEGMSRFQKFKVAYECFFAVIFFCIGMLCVGFWSDSENSSIGDEQ